IVTVRNRIGKLGPTYKTPSEGQVFRLDSRSAAGRFARRILPFLRAAPACPVQWPLLQPAPQRHHRRAVPGIHEIPARPQAHFLLYRHVHHVAARMHAVEELSDKKLVIYRLTGEPRGSSEWIGAIIEIIRRVGRTSAELAGILSIKMGHPMA